jgi:hypothetical protein
VASSTHAGGGDSLATWSPPPGLDPYHRDLTVLMLRTRDQVADLPVAEALKVLGRPYGWESEALVPLPGPARMGWSDDRMFRAIAREDDCLTLKGEASSPLLEAIDREMVRRLADGPAAPVNLAERSHAIRSEVTGRVVDFMKGGRRLDERVAVESDLLERQSAQVLERRFRDSPISSLRPMPDRGEARRAWLEDALRAEHAAASEGMMSPSALVEAARSPRGPVPDHREPAPPVPDRRRERHAELAREAARIEGMSDASLRLRCRDVPGVADARVPLAGQGDERRVWIEAMLLAQGSREAMRGARTPSPAGPASDGMRLAGGRDAGRSADAARPRTPAPAMTYAMAAMMASGRA